MLAPASGWLQLGRCTRWFSCFVDFGIGMGTAGAFVLHLTTISSDPSAPGFDWCFNWTVGLAVKYIVVIVIAMVHFILRDTDRERDTVLCRGIILAVDVGGGLFLVLVQLLDGNKSHTCGSVVSQRMQSVWLCIVSLRTICLMMIIARKERQRVIRDAIHGGLTEALPPARLAGLSAAEIDSIPTAVSNGEPGINCSVCIDAIEAGNPVKTMPLCKHCFHAECISVWLKTRNLCPNCRSLVITRS